MQHDVETVLSQSSRGELWVCVWGFAPLQNVIHQEAKPTATELTVGITRTTHCKLLRVRQAVDRHLSRDLAQQRQASIDKPLFLVTDSSVIGHITFQANILQVTHERSRLPLARAKDFCKRAAI